MHIQKDVSLKQHSTMRLGGTAAYLCEISDISQLTEAVAWAKTQQLPATMIGDGSNIVWKDEGYEGLLLVNKLLRFETRQDDNDLVVTVGSGENWDDTVRRVVELGYSGLEELSLIPGTVGATPVQNVGAYGREIADVLLEVEAYDQQVDDIVYIPAEDCAFGYRTSRFKATDKDRFLITSITFRVTRSLPTPPFYDSLTKYFSERNITSYTPQIVRDAVIDIRQSKLPDPLVIANNGSFFANPIVSSQVLAEITRTYPDIVNWSLPDGRVKLSAAWLLEQAGFKDYRVEATHVTVAE